MSPERATLRIDVSVGGCWDLRIYIRDHEVRLCFVYCEGERLVVPSKQRFVAAVNITESQTQHPARSSRVARCWNVWKSPRCTLVSLLHDLSEWVSSETLEPSEYEGKETISSFCPSHPNVNVPQSSRVGPPSHRKGERPLTNNLRRPPNSR